jgi:hypothetical protein
LMKLTVEIKYYDSSLIFQLNMKMD